MKVLLGICGSISAYKSCDIVSGLIATGNEVKIIMTKASLKFAPIEALKTLSKNDVLVESDGLEHIELSEWCDCMSIAPATLNTINKIYYGISDNLLLDACSALPKGKKRLIFPAMNTNMLGKMKLPKDWYVSDTDIGVLACGIEGNGKLLKARKIVEIINS